MGETPFSLTYNMEAVLPLEILSESLWVTSFDADSNEVERKQDLDKLDVKHQAARLRKVAYKAHTKNLYNKQVSVKNFKIGEWVLSKNEASHWDPPGNLSVTWKGPYKLVGTHWDGEYILDAQDGRLVPRTWNARKLRHFLL